MTNYKIIDNLEDDGYIYEFSVAKKIDEKTFEVVAHYSDGFLAGDYAHKNDYVILHNCRIAGKEKKKQLTK